MGNIIKVVVEGSDARGVKQIELDGHDITHLCTDFKFHAQAGELNQLLIRLAGNVQLTIDFPPVWKSQERKEEE